MNWNKYPFIRLVSALSLGIVLHEVWGCSNPDRRWLFAVLLMAVAVLTVLHRVMKSYRYRWIYGVSVLLAFAYVGYFRACLLKAVMQTEDGNRMMHNGWCLARVYEPPTEREKTVKVILDIVGFENETGMTRVEGKVMAYFQKTEEALRLDYGDLLAFQKPMEKVDPPKNPMEFDYRKYLERRGVAGMVYLEEGDWMPTRIRRENVLFSFAYRFRGRMMEAMRQCGIDGDEFSVGTAVLLGYDDSLPAQVRHNYVAAGSMHILCVSGMHVGIIYLLASTLLGLLGRSRIASFFKKMILLILIWCYALITGLSPSIMRSTLMISMILFGEIIHRKGFTLNSIAASAFVLLLLDPNNLFAIGFQLSYVAVVGIVLLQKPLSNLLYVRNKLLGKAWEITTVSIAAQIATMPLTVYYFNQFTPYFWLSNLLMTPLSFAVILSGMLLLAFSWVPGLNVFLGKIVGYGLRWMNAVALGVERLPLSLVKGLYMDDAQFGMSLVLLLLLLLFVNLRKKRMMMEMLVLSAVFASSLAWRSFQQAHQSQVMLYSLRNHTAISVVDGFDHMLLCDEGLLEEPSAIDYSLKGHWAEEQLAMNPRCYILTEDFSDHLALKKGNLISTQGLLLALWDENHLDDGLSYRLPVDYLLVTGRQRPDISSVLYSYAPQTLLIDGSVPKYLAEQWMAQAKENGMPYVNIGEGSFKVN